MTTQYNIYSYVQGVNGFGAAPCDTMYSAVLAANAASTVTVPGSSAQGALSGTGYSKFIAIINTNGPDVWMAHNKTAAYPVATSLAASDVKLLAPNANNGFYVRGGDTLSFISGDSDTGLNVAFYAIQEG